MWIVSYLDDGGRRHNIRFPEEKEAREERQELIKEGFDCGPGILHVPDREVRE